MDWVEEIVWVSAAKISKFVGFTPGSWKIFMQNKDVGEKRINFRQIVISDLISF